MSHPDLCSVQPSGQPLGAGTDSRVGRTAVGSSGGLGGTGGLGPGEVSASRLGGWRGKSRGAKRTPRTAAMQRIAAIGQVLGIRNVGGFFLRTSGCTARMSSGPAAGRHQVQTPPAAPLLRGRADQRRSSARGVGGVESKVGSTGPNVARAAHERRRVRHIGCAPALRVRGTAPELRDANRIVRRLRHEVRWRRTLSAPPRSTKARRRSTKAEGFSTKCRSAEH